MAITFVLGLVLVFTATSLYHPAVHRKLLTFLVMMVSLPLGAALHFVDRWVCRSRRLRGLPEVARTGLVVLAGIALTAALMALGYGLAELAHLNEAAF